VSKKIKKTGSLKEDPVYNNLIVSKFINYVMERGKKLIAQKIIYSAFQIIEEKEKKDPIKVFELAIKNTSPIFEVKSKRVGGATYQVPFPVKGDRALFLSLNWIINSAKSKKGKAMKDNLAKELIDSANNIGGAVKKKEEVHKIAEANKAFAHFANY